MQLRIVKTVVSVLVKTCGRKCMDALSLLPADGHRTPTLVSFLELLLSQQQPAMREKLEPKLATPVTVASPLLKTMVGVPPESSNKPVQAVQLDSNVSDKENVGDHTGVQPPRVDLLRERLERLKTKSTLVPAATKDLI